MYVLMEHERRVASPAHNNYHQSQSHHHHHHKHNKHNNLINKLTQSQILSSTPNPSKQNAISSTFRYGPLGEQFTTKSPLINQTSICIAMEEARRKAARRSERSPSYRGSSKIIENNNKAITTSNLLRHRSATQARETTKLLEKDTFKTKRDALPIASVQVKNTILNNCKTSPSSRLSRSQLTDRNNNVSVTAARPKQQYPSNSNNFPYCSSNIPDVVPKLNLTPKNSPLTTTFGLFLDIRNSKSNHIVVNDLRSVNKESSSSETKKSNSTIMQRVKETSRHTFKDGSISNKKSPNSYDLDATIPSNKIILTNNRTPKALIGSSQQPPNALKAKAMSKSVLDSEEQIRIAKRSLQRRRRLREIEEAQVNNFKDFGIRKSFYDDYDDDVTDYDIADDFDFYEAGLYSYSIPNSPNFPIVDKASLSIKPPQTGRSDYNLLSNNNRMTSSIVCVDPYENKLNEKIALSNQELQRTRGEQSYQHCNDVLTTFYNEKRLPLSLFNEKNNTDAKMSSRREKAALLNYDDNKNLMEPDILETEISTRKKRIEASKKRRDGVLTRSKSQSRPYNILPSMSSSKITSKDIRRNQDAFLVSRSKTSHNLISSTNEATTSASHTPTSGSLLSSWRSFTRLAYGSTNALNNRSRAKTPQRLPLSDDATAVLEIYDPVENDRRRENLMRNAFLAFNDSIGFDIVQQELKSFRHLKQLALGRTRLVKIADLPIVERLNAAEILKKYKLYLQRPKKKPLQEYYNDDDAELEGKF